MLPGWAPSLFFSASCDGKPINRGLDEFGGRLGWTFLFMVSGQQKRAEKFRPALARLRIHLYAGGGNLPTCSCHAQRRATLRRCAAPARDAMRTARASLVRDRDLTT